MSDAYTDLTIRIRGKNDVASDYPVEAMLEDGRGFAGQLALDQSALAQNDLNPEAYGTALFRALFTGNLRQAYDQALGLASGTGGRLRLRLWIDPEAAELHALPWERLYQQSGLVMKPLTTSDLTPFSRYTRLPIPEPPPVSARPLKLLVAIANPRNLPNNLPEANVEVEIQSLRKALGDLRQSGQLQVTILPGQSGLTAPLRDQLRAEGYQILEGLNTTLDNLVQQLPGQHIFHYIGHGAFVRNQARGSGQAVLYLEKEDGAWQGAKDDEIVARLGAMGSLPPLTVLIACESASRDIAAGGEDAFVGLGPKLVQAGFPAVVAMQAQVPVEAARTFYTEFYRRLMEHGEVDKAMNQARFVIFKPNRTDWSIPVLFMRLKTGALFVEKEATLSDDKANDKPATVTHVSGDAVSGNKVVEGGINFGNIGGSVNIGGNVSARDMNVSTVTNVTNASGPAAAGGENKWFILETQLKKARKTVDSLSVDDDEKDELKDLIRKIETEVKKGDEADTKKIDRWLGNLKDISTDALAATVKALTNPAAGVPDTIKAVAQDA